MVCVLSVWIPVENQENPLSHPSEPSVLDFSLLPPGEFHVVFHSLIIFENSPLVYLRILSLFHQEEEQSQHEKIAVLWELLAEMKLRETHSSWQAPFLHLCGIYLA